MKIQNRIAAYLPPPLRPAEDGGEVAIPDVKELMARAEETIKQYPGPALAVAFAAGVVFAWWIKRM